MGSQRINDPWEVLRLIKEEELIPGKSYLRSGEELFKLMKVLASNRRLNVYLLANSGEVLSLSQNEFRKMNFEMVQLMGITCEDWVDPA